MSIYEYAARGKIKELRALLDEGHKFNGFGCCLSTPLHKAASNGHEEVVRLLLDLGVYDYALRDGQGWFVLHHAAWKGNVTIGRMILDYESKVMDVDVNQVNNDKETALNIATMRGNKDFVCLLLERGANP